MTKLTAEMESELRHVFSRFDSDSNGLIDQREFRHILFALGEDPTEEVLSLNFAAIDTNHDKKIVFEEFAEWWLDYQR